MWCPAIWPLNRLNELEGSARPWVGAATEFLAVHVAANIQRYLCSWALQMHPPGGPLSAIACNHLPLQRVGCSPAAQAPWFRAEGHALDFTPPNKKGPALAGPSQ